MKKSELRQLIREVIKSSVNEAEFNITVDNSDLEYITVNSSNLDVLETPPRGGTMNGAVLKDWKGGFTNVAKVFDIYINEKYRKQGLGQKMFEAFKNALPSTVDTIMADVVDSAAKPFWKKMGFTTEDGRDYSLKLR